MSSLFLLSYSISSNRKKTCCFIFYFPQSSIDERLFRGIDMILYLYWCHMPINLFYKYNYDFKWEKARRLSVGGLECSISIVMIEIDLYVFGILAFFEWYTVRGGLYRVGVLWRGCSGSCERGECIEGSCERGVVVKGVKRGVVWVANV